MPRIPVPEPEAVETPEPEVPEQVKDDEPEREALPVHKDDLVAVAIERGIPSYEAWNLTVPELTERLES